MKDILDGTIIESLLFKSKEALEKLLKVSCTESYTRIQDNYYFNFQTLSATSPSAKKVADFVITVLPPGDIAYFHSVEVQTEYRNKGVGSLLHQLRLDIVKDNCTLLLAQVNTTNTFEEKILNKFKWKKAVAFEATRSNNKMNLWYKTDSEQCSCKLQDLMIRGCTCKGK